MADVCTVTREMEAKWKAWAKRRPKVIKDLARRFKPWKLYLLKSSGHRVFPISFFENGTLTVAVTGRYNLINFERQVFGIKPEDLEECDLPGSDERVGVLFNDEQTLHYINLRRAELGIAPLKKLPRGDEQYGCAVGYEEDNEKTDNQENGHDRETTNGHA